MKLSELQRDRPGTSRADVESLRSGYSGKRIEADTSFI